MAAWPVAEISTRNTSLQPYLHYLQQISQPSLQPYLPILVTFHSCNTSMQPYAFPLLQTHLCRNDSASAQGSLPRSPPPRALHPPRPPPFFILTASILHPHRLHSSSSSAPASILHPHRFGWPSGAPISRGSTVSMIVFGGRRGPYRSGSRCRGRPIERREAGREGCLWPDAASQGRPPDGSGG